MKINKKAGAVEKINNSMAALVFDYCFWGIIGLSLKIKEATNILTCGTDGIHLFYNEKWVSELKKDERLGLMAHEILHVALLHNFRAGGRNHELWNKACDYVINLILLDASFILPPDGLIDKRFTGMSEEAVYDMLFKESPPSQPKKIFIQIGDGQGDKAPGSGEGKDGEGENGNASGDGYIGDLIKPVDGDGNPLSPDQVKELVENIKITVANARKAAKDHEKATGRGSMPGSLELLLGELFRPKVDWKTVLYNFISYSAKNNHTWMYPNKRMAGAGLYLPTQRSEKLFLAVAYDTSGSCADKETVTRFASEVNGAVTVFNAEGVLMYADTEVSDVVEFSSLAPLEFKPYGGGGTSFIPPFKYLEEQGITPDCFIYLTDLDGDFPDEAPPYPVIWANVGGRDKKAPFGTTIYIGED